MKKQRRTFNHDLSPGAFIKWSLSLSLLFILGFTALNYYTNDFSLWRSRESARIWALEKTSKYLLAHRYVPDHYDGILIGSSVSANIDPAQISNDIKIYNISMAGGNMTEISAAAKLYINRAKNPKLMVVSLHPYMLAGSGMKSFQIHEKEYFGSLFSALPAMIWAAKIFRALNMSGAEFDHSENGWNNLESNTPVKDMDTQMISMKENCEKEDWKSNMIDPTAYQQLSDLLTLARAKNMRIIAYFHPYLSNQWAIYKSCGKGLFFQKEVRKLFLPDEQIIDFNTPQYSYITNNRKLRLDLAHLNRKGAGLLAKELNRTIRNEQ